MMLSVVWVSLAYCCEIATFQYETADQAVATRQALHGKRWPASNPKLLGVEFRNMEEVSVLFLCLMFVSPVFFRLNIDMRHMHIFLQSAAVRFTLTLHTHTHI